MLPHFLVSDCGVWVLFNTVQIRTDDPDFETGMEIILEPNKDCFLT